MARMASFLTIFLSIYTAMHLVVYFGIRPLLAGHRLHLFVPLFMGIMVAAPVLVRALERAGQEGAARALAVIGYSWMGFLFLAFALFMLLFGWNLVCWGAGKAVPAAATLTLYGPRSSAAVLLVVLGFGLYSCAAAIRPRLETVHIETVKLPAGVDHLRLVQISDLHLGLIHRRLFLRRLVRRIEKLNPDLLVATGDIVDAQINHLDGLAELFAKLRPPLGKYAVTGNHEFYAGGDQSLDFIRSSGFTVLRNTTGPHTLPIQLVGVDDPAGGGHPDEVSLLQQLDRDKFTVLLKHRPQVTPQAEGLFDLQLSGHTHGGQIFPFGLLTKLAYPLPAGSVDLPGGSRLYTSRGTGTWGPPMRLFAPPEIALFKIIRTPQGVP